MLSALIVMGPLESYYSRQCVDASARLTAAVAAMRIDRSGDQPDLIAAALIAESKGDWETAYTYGVQARHYRNEGK